MLAVFRKCDVGSIATRVRSELRGRFIERLLVAAGDGDLSAFGDKKTSSGKTDAAIASGNESLFAYELHNSSW